MFSVATATPRQVAREPSWRLNEKTRVWRTLKSLFTILNKKGSLFQIRIAGTVDGGWFLVIGVGIDCDSGFFSRFGAGGRAFG